MKLLALLLLAVCIFAAPKPSPTLPSGGGISLNPQSWTLDYWGGSHAKGQAVAGGGVAFDFPQHVAPQTGKYAAYFTISPGGIAISGELSVTINLVTTGSPIFWYDSEVGNVCVTPATVRPYITGPGKFPAPNARYWSNPQSYTLAAGTITLTIPLDVDNWSDTFGYRDPAAFAAVLSNVGAIGLSIGGGCYFGHGVNVSNGTARLEILSYSTY